VSGGGDINNSSEGDAGTLQKLQTGGESDFQSTLFLVKRTQASPKASAPKEAEERGEGLTSWTGGGSNEIKTREKRQIVKPTHSCHG